MFANIDALVGQAAEQHPGEFRIIPRHRACGLDNRNGGTEPAVRLRHLDTHRTRPDDDEAVGQHVVVEDGLVREVGHRINAGDGRDCRLRSGRDDNAPGADRSVAGSNLARPDKARLGAHHIDPETREALGRIMRRDRVDHPAHVPANRGEIDIRHGAVNPEPAGIPYRMRRLGGGEQRLRRHAPGIEAFAAHFGPFDQDRARAELGGDRGRGQPGGTSPDHAQIDDVRAHRAATDLISVPRRRRCSSCKTGPAAGLIEAPGVTAATRVAARAPALPGCRFAVRSG